MKKYFVFTIREFLGLENDYETILNNQEEILTKISNLEKIKLENQGLILEDKQTSYYDYITLRNLLLILIFLGFIERGFWLYNTDLFNNAILESIKSLSTLSKDLHTFDHKEVYTGIGLLGLMALISLRMPPIGGLIVRSLTLTSNGTTISSIESVEEIIRLRNASLKKMLNIIRK